MTLTLSATPSAEIADSTLLTFTATTLDNGFGYYAGVVADSNAAKTYRVRRRSRSGTPTRPSPRP